VSGFEQELLTRDPIQSRRPINERIIANRFTEKIRLERKILSCTDWTSLA